MFVTAGMGGGTGTGAAPVIAAAAREQGILTIGVVTKPFHFEGRRRMQSAEQGILELEKVVDTLIVIPNQNLFKIANEKTTFADAFKMADDVLHMGVRGVTDLMVMPGLINLDFADIRTVMGEMGKAMMGTGEAEGPDRSRVAVIGRPLPGGPPIDPTLQPGMYAVDANTGAIKWQYSVKPDCANGRDKKAPRCERTFGFSGAPTLIDGALVQGSLDGRLFVIDARTGRELWKYDSLRDYQTLNGVPAKGGSIDGASIVAVNGLLLSGSGYGMFGQAPGNALLAFKPK